MPSASSRAGRAAMAAPREVAAPRPRRAGRPGGRASRGHLQGVAWPAGTGSAGPAPARAPGAAWIVAAGRPRTAAVCSHAVVAEQREHGQLVLLADPQQLLARSAAARSGSSSGRTTPPSSLSARPEQRRIADAPGEVDGLGRRGDRAGVVLAADLADQGAEQPAPLLVGRGSAAAAAARSVDDAGVDCARSARLSHGVGDVPGQQRSRSASSSRPVRSRDRQGLLPRVDGDLRAAAARAVARSSPMRTAIALVVTGGDAGGVGGPAAPGRGRPNACR